MIDFSKFDSDLKGNVFAYAQFVSMTDFAAGKPCRHCIKLRPKGCSGGWAWLGDKGTESGRMEFSTEREARQAVAVLNRWSTTDSEHLELINSLIELVAQMEEKGHSRGGDAPGHSHRIKGIWDDDNGDLSGKPCALCALWNKACGLVEKDEMRELMK